MPQGHRKVPFSGKQKKAQISAKRNTKVMKNISHKKMYNNDTESSSDESGNNGNMPLQLQLDRVQKLNTQPASRSNRSKPNRYALQFYRETEKELRKMKEEAHKPLEEVCETELEISKEYFNNFDFPKRPDWNYNMSKEELEREEHRYFNNYIMKLEQKFENKQKFSYFELNLETWRQLWRVLEISDILLIIVDIRYPSLMFPASLYEYITKELGKNIILVLNKIDLVPATLVLAWKKYFEEKFENLNIVMFTSFPSYHLKIDQENPQCLKIRRQRGKQKMAAESALQVIKECKKIVKNEVDLHSWEQKIFEEMKEDNDNEDDTSGTVLVTETKLAEKYELRDHVKYNDGILTIGCIGFPNVGKSSLLNTLMGKKVVSVSRTPGHTKHFQTIFLTNNVKLCDCPGLVFPSAVPRKLQVLMGSYPVAQLREPYAAVKYLAERINLPKLLNIQKANCEDVNKSWSPTEICESWAIKRGFFTAKAARPDTYRAANNILRMALDGKIALCLRPLGFADNIDKWSTHPELEEIRQIQELKKMSEVEDDEVDEEFSSSEDEVQEADQAADADDSTSDFPVYKNKFSLLNDDD